MSNQIKLSLRNRQAPGDLLMLSAAIRDLHACYPNQYLTEVKSSCPEIWYNNPFITEFGKNEKHVKKIRCEYPLIHKSNELPYHFIHGFIHFLNEKLNLNIRPTAFKGDIHLSEEEKSDVILRKFGIAQPFWLLNAGGKKDFTIKWWEASRYQEVMDHYKGRIQFVQVGAKEHYHPSLEGVIDLRGKTTVRELIRLMHHAQGVVTPVSLLMHLTAAVETKPESDKLRPCVVIAGGREPAHWEEYPGHQFIHTIGVLPCCANGGCWRSRTVALGDGSVNDKPENLCLDVVMKTSHNPSFQGSSPGKLQNDIMETLRSSEKQTENAVVSTCFPEERRISSFEQSPNFKKSPFQGEECLPRCMDMITAQEVIRRIDLYLDGGVFNAYKKTHQTKNPHSMFGKFRNKKVRNLINPLAEAKVPLIKASNGRPPFITEKNSQKEIEAFLKTVGTYPEDEYNGKGIVICGGGEKYFPGTWVLVNMLRYHSCTLPIEVWYLGEDEMDAHMTGILSPLNVRCIDGYEVRQKHPCRILNGWELKAFALLHNSFEEVLLLDADNIPINDVTQMFSWPEYKQTGAIFWPDVGKLSKGRRIWELVGTPYREEPEFESGQILVDKSRCWEALNLSLWLNEFSDFYYRYIHGDKETFHMAFRKTKTEYAMPSHHVKLLQGTMYQHDFEADIVFQHRNGFKWNLESNRRLKDFHFEEECIGFVELLKNLWSGKINGPQLPIIGLEVLNITSALWFYERVGFDKRVMVFLPDGKIGYGAETCEQKWQFGTNGSSGKLLLIGTDGVTCELEQEDSRTWRGKWLKHEQMPVRLSVAVAPLPNTA